jgi:hypothetical protein
VITVLEKFYNLDTIIIPPYKVNRLKILPGIICRDKMEWADKIISSICDEAL